MASSFGGGDYGPREPEPTRFRTALEILKALLANIATPIERVDLVISQAVQYADALRDRIAEDLANELEEEVRKKVPYTADPGSNSNSNQSNGGGDPFAAFNPLR